MVLHLTFRDGSNPYVVFGNREKCLREYRRIDRKHGGRLWEAAEVVLMLDDGYFIRTGRTAKLFALCHRDYPGAYLDRVGPYYLRLGNALRAYDRITGKERGAVE